MTKPKILLVDYDPKTIESTLGPLSDAGYDVEVAKDGEAGLEALGRVAPDLVLVEMMLPKIPGLELCREIRRARPDVGPAILILGRSSAEKYRAQAIACGANAYVPRTIEPERLVEICNLHLGGSPVDSAPPFTPPEQPRESFVGPHSMREEAKELAAPAPDRAGSGARPTKLRRGGQRRNPRAWGIAAAASTLILGGAFVMRPRDSAAPEPRPVEEIKRRAPLEATVRPEQGVPVSLVPREAPSAPPAGDPRIDAISHPEPSAPKVPRASPPAMTRILPGIVVHERPPAPESAKEKAASESGAQKPELLAETTPPKTEGPDAIGEPEALSVLPAPPTLPSARDATTAPPSHPASAGEVVDLSEVDAAPVAKSRLAPRYPEAARRMRREGRVILRLLVDETGKVANVERVGGSRVSEFLPAAEQAVRSWTYEPAMKDGVRVKVWLTVQVVFKS